MKKNIMALAASLALVGAAGCGGDDCGSNDCPILEDAGMTEDAGIPDQDASISPEKTDVLKYMEQIGALVNKNVVRIMACSQDEDSIKGRIGPYLSLIEPALPVIEEELVSGRLDINWSKVRPCVDELLLAATALDALADTQQDICTLLTEDTLLPFLTREKIPGCSKLVEDVFAYVMDHEDELYRTDRFLDSLYAFLPFIANPTVELGGECALNYECKEGICVGNTPLTCGGTCVPYKQEGEHCTYNQQCADGYFCFEGICTASGTEDGAFCDEDVLPCASGFYCDYRSSSCVAKRKAGESACIKQGDNSSYCTRDLCESGNYSYNDDDEKICAERKPDGQPCDSDRECVSDFCDDNHPVTGSELDGICAKQNLRFPGDECGQAGDICLASINSCDMSLEIPVCATTYKQVSAGQECSSDDDCLGMDSSCVGVESHYDSETDQVIIDKMGTCAVPLNKGEKCDPNYDMCKTGLTCVSDDESEDPPLFPPADAGSGEPVASEGHCDADYLELGDVCYNPLDSSDRLTCNPANSFCGDVNETELNAIISAVIADECGTPVSEDCKNALTEEIMEYLEGTGLPRVCRELKKNNMDCGDMSECASGYCDILSGSYICLDLPDISKLDVCQIPSLANIVLMMD